METCDGGDELSLGTDNLYKYEAVVKNEGEALERELRELSWGVGVGGGT